MTLLITGIILAVLTLFIDVFTDYKLWLKGKGVNHNRGAALRLLGLIPACYLIGWIATPFVFSAYWCLFDGLYNNRRYFDWWFTGSNDKDDAKFDNFLQRMSRKEIIITKTAAMVLSAALIIYSKV